jgi:hypothetical protein
VYRIIFLYVGEEIAMPETLNETRRRNLTAAERSASRRDWARIILSAVAVLVSLLLGLLQR